MTLLEFLIQVLEAHAETLKRLDALFGEDTLVLVLERAGELEEVQAEKGILSSPPVDPSCFEEVEPSYSFPEDPYLEVETAVRAMKLSERLTFHLWAYRHYREWVESPADLWWRIPGPGGEAGLKLVDDTRARAEGWIKRLGLPEPLGTQAARAAHVPWLRFRTVVLKRIGRRPLGPAY